jgi:CRISPR-associated protein Cas2
MPMTVVVTRDVAPRSRGFLASCMLEIAPGVYTSPQMSAGVRERVWAVLSDWHAVENAGSVAMTWPDEEAPGGQRVLLLGEPAKDLWDVDGIILVRRELSMLAASGSLKTE